MTGGKSKELLSFPWTAAALAAWGGENALERSLRALECHGLELIWAGEELPASLPGDLICGYHLLFYPDWLDFWRGDQKRLTEKFGSRESYERFYGGKDGGCLLEQYRQDLQRAKALGASYVVFHVSDVSLEESYTYRWQHSSREVIDGAAELLNQLKGDWPFPILLENQWWPGLTLLEPELVDRLLSRVNWPDKGLLLDTGHLMNTRPQLRTQKEGIFYLQQVLQRLGPLQYEIRGVHLHQSLSGSYVRRTAGSLPVQPEEYLQRFAQNYQHILHIDRHRPWTCPEIASLLQEIGPEYVIHELSGATPAARIRALRRQKRTLQLGGWPEGTI